jgi:sucrose phosphorylase
VSWLRLDAVGFVWKEAGTTCLHRPEAYTVVRILRQLLERVSSRGVVVTETNVPEQENLSYLRSGMDAHLAYNFPLPPLLVEALISRRADLLNEWLARWPKLPAGSSLLNFSACHDGIGLRPLEGLMPPERLHELLVACERRGGLVSHRRLASGKESPYEINISWWSAMADGGVDPSHLQLQRFLLSQLLVMALPGVPAFYLPALLGAANDMKQFRSTGHRRDLNRPKFQAERLERQLADPDQPASKILKRLQAAMKLRSQRPAMDPEAPMELLSSERSDVVILKRGTPSQALWAVHNFSNRRVSFPLERMLQVDSDTTTLSWSDVLNGTSINGPYLELEPFAVHWLELS